MRLFGAVLVMLALVVSACHGGHVPSSEIDLVVSDFMWSGGVLPEDATVTCTIYEQAEGTTGWVLVAEDIPWTDTLLELPYAYTMAEEGNYRWRIDVSADIDGELYEYSCLTDWTWVGRIEVQCRVRAAGVPE